MSKAFRAGLARPWGWGNPYATHFIRPKDRGNQRGFNSSTGYRGVWQSAFAPRVPRWRACISVDDKTVHLGAYTTPIAAAMAYDRAARLYHGADAVYNFAYLMADRRFGHERAALTEALG